MERKLRLTTGLILFAYAACHFLGHATGVFGVATMEAVGRGILLAPWRTMPGRGVLLGALLIHAALGLYALFRRRHLRIPALEAWQLALGLAIPLLLVPHVIGVRAGASLFGLDDSYRTVLDRIWIAAGGLVQHFALLTLVWAHGCIGLGFWLRRHDWSRRHRDLLLAGAVALPFLAALGIINAGWDAATSAGAHAEQARAAIDPSIAASKNTLANWTRNLQFFYFGLLGLVGITWLARNAMRRGGGAVRVAFPNGRVVVAPRGFSVLETSRWAGIAHASSCGGRGRCSTCRVQIVAGEKNLPEISPAERETLERIKAPPHVRLACQLRPTADVEIAPLVPVSGSARDTAVGSGESGEMLVTAMFIDLRGSTRFAAGRLPFDALYIIERYVQLVTAAIEAHGGVVTGVAGDGVMSLFGARSEPLAGARGALRAIGSVWDAIDALSREFAGELDGPIAFGAGLDVSLAAVRSHDVLGRASLQFLGDAGNVASRLEAATKTYQCTCVISESVFRVAEAAIPETLAREDAVLRGLEDRVIPVRLAFNRGEVDFGEFVAPKEEAL
jgi:adenylate cyclase